MRGAQQHRGVRVVAAGVHLTVDFRGERQPGALAHRQRVQVGPQRSHTARQGAVDARDDPGFRDAPVRDSQGVELALDERGRLVLLEAEFGAPVDRAPQLDDSRCQDVADFDCHSGEVNGPVLYLPPPKRDGR